MKFVKNNFEKNFGKKNEDKTQSKKKIIFITRNQLNYENDFQYPNHLSGIF